MLEVSLNNDKIVISTIVGDDVQEGRIFSGQKELEFGENKVIIKTVTLEGGFSEQLPYTTVKEVLLVDLGNTPKGKVSFELMCKDNQYFFAAEKGYLQLLNALNNNPHNYSEEQLEEARNQLIENISPKIQLLKHSVTNNGFKTRLTRSRLNNLLSYSDEETKIFEDLFDYHAYYSDLLPRLFEDESNKFYVVIGEFNVSATNNQTNNILNCVPSFDNNSFRDRCGIAEVDKKDNLKDKSIAIVIHGLGSSCINEANSYENLVTYLSTDFKVFTFDYLTINQQISQSARLLDFAISELQTKYTDRKIYIFAHSMGGLVARSALVVQQTEFEYLLMAGTPNRGARKASVIKLAKRVFLWFVKKTIKYQDYYDLMLGYHEGLKSLANKTKCISQLNLNDIGNENMYYCMAGRLDFLAIKSSVTRINGRSLPSRNILISNWIHTNYFKGDLANSVGELLKRHAEATPVEMVR
ncbi:hypothetical protein COJ07_29150 [Bacillus cereus]|uniref:esterase/lipase family protein n=1 Tax=Bacillus cereus TaxID=1396 RepID=UPI000BF77DEB|nr:alpha/beta hydrolase [Bacillus cereus]PFL13992.1 hypothetical protein COJ07_29150 [Bacillus cereus]